MIYLIVFLIFPYILNGYYLFPYANSTNDNYIELQRSPKYGPVILKNNEISLIFDIYSDGYIKFNNNCKKISVFNLQAWTSSLIYYREIKQLYLLSKYSNYVKKIKRFFLAKWGIQITWYNHIVNSVSRSENNSFQIILLLNGYEEFVILNYFRIDFSKITHLNFAGFSDENCNFKNFINLSNTNLLLDSNIGKKGVFVFNIDNFFQDNSKSSFQDNSKSSILDNLKSSSNRKKIDNLFLIFFFLFLKFYFRIY